MLFDESLPPETVYKPPSYATKRKGLLAFLGYKPDGTQNTWGKIMSWIPGAGSIASNKLAENVARKSGASDTADNIQDDLDNRVNKQLGLLKIGAGVARAASGDVMGGIQTGMGGISNIVSTASSPVDRSENSWDRTTSYLRFAEGGTPTKDKKPKLAAGGTDSVAAFQKMLNDKLGLKLATDGAWGPKTQAAYEAYSGLKDLSTVTAAGVEPAPAPAGEIMTGIWPGERMTGIRPGERMTGVPALMWPEHFNNGVLVSPRPNSQPVNLPPPSAPVVPVAPSTRRTVGVSDWTPVVPRVTGGYSDWTPTNVRRIGNNVVTPGSWTRFEKGGTVAGSNPGKIYAEHDTTEDIYLVDKNKAKALGIDKVVEKARIGEMRYEETIFDQKATKEIDRLIKEGKINELGNYVKEERATHRPSVIAFAGGGTPTQGVQPRRGRPAKTTPRQIVSPSIASNLRKASESIVPLLPQDQTAGQSVFPWLQDALSTDSLLNNYMTGAQSKVSAGDPTLSEVTVRASRTAPTPTPTKPYNTGLQRADLGKIMSNHSANLAKEGENVPRTTASRQGFNVSGNTLDNVLGGIDSLGQLAVGSMMASKGLPSWTVSSDWIDLRNRAKLLSEQGYTPSEIAFGNRQINNSAQMSARNVVNQLGGGGSTGAVIAGLQNVQDAAANASVNLAVQDAQQRRQNFGSYTNILAQDTGYDLQKFGIDYQNDASRMNAGLGLIQNGLQNIQDQASYNRTYGPNSDYQRLVDAYLRQIEKGNASLSRDGISSFLK